MIHHSIKVIINLCILGALLALSMPSLAQVFIYRGRIDDPLTQAGRRYKEVQTADLDQDGWPDLYACQKQGNGSIWGTNIDRVLIHNGSGSWADVSTFFTLKSQPLAFNQLLTNRGYDVEMGDLDGDGHLDVARPETGGHVDILWGDGTGKFPSVANVINPSNDPDQCYQNNQWVACGNYDNVAIGDIDRDGDLDVLVANYRDGSAQNVVLRNRLSDGFPRQFFIETGQLPGNETHDLSLADVDEDGWLDVAIANPGNNSQLCYGSASGFGNCIFLTVPGPHNPTTETDFFDFDRDGLLDIYIAKAAYTNIPPPDSQHGIYFQNPNGSFVYHALPRGNGDLTVYDARYADFDGDGDIEIVRTNILRSGVSPTLQAIRVQCDRTSSDVTQGFFNGVFHGEMALESIDIDGDGDLDLVLGGSDLESSNLNLGSAALHFYENTANREPIFADGFESGNFVNWGPSLVVGNVSLSVDKPAALCGEYGYAAKFDNDGTTGLNRRGHIEDPSPSGETAYVAQFYLNPQNMTMAHDERHDIFIGSSNTTGVTLGLRLIKNGGAYDVFAYARLDSGSYAWTPRRTLAAGGSKLEVIWYAADAGANNGSVSISIDGGSPAEVTALDNDQRRLDSVRLGILWGIDAGTYGTHHFDHFSSFRIND